MLVKAALGNGALPVRHLADSDCHGQCSPTCIRGGSDTTTNSFACCLISDITWLTVVQVRFPAPPLDQPSSLEVGFALMMDVSPQMTFL